MMVGQLLALSTVQKGGHHAADTGVHIGWLLGRLSWSYLWNFSASSLSRAQFLLTGSSRAWLVLALAVLVRWLWQHECTVQSLLGLRSRSNIEVW